MRFACMEVSTVQVFWSCFQLANSGLRTSEISTYPALKLVAQQSKFSSRCHFSNQQQITDDTHKFSYGKMASSKPIRTCLASHSLKPLLKLSPAAQLCAAGAQLNSCMQAVISTHAMLASETQPSISESKEKE